MQDGRAQFGLFEDIPIDSKGGGSAAKAAAGPALVRVSAVDDDLSPLQKKFNAQAKKIERLRADVDSRTATYNEILAHWSKRLAPLQKEVAGLQIRLAFTLETRAKGFKLGVRQRETAGEAILGLLNDAFGATVPDEEARELFSRWNDIAFDEEVDRQTDEAVETLSDAIKEYFGIDLDPEILKKGPEGIHEALDEAMKEAMPGPGTTKSGRPRKKTQKQLEREERERSAEESAKKSIRSLYLSLVKVLHPDAELDGRAKLEKEKVLKEVTAAYEAGDLHTLLRLEADWLARESENSGRIADDKLKVYLAALKEQAQDIEAELEALRFSPRYGQVSEYLSDYYDMARQHIDSDARDEGKRIKLLTKLVAEFSKEMEKQTFLSRLRELLD